jgi:hypothetical protein
MAMLTYTSAAHGFGVTYDGAWLTHVDDPADPRLLAAWASRIPTAISGSVLFAPRGASAADIAAGRVPTQFITTDDAPVPPRELATWDWDDVTRRVGALFFDQTGVEAVEATAVYWRGLPVLQLSAVPVAEPALGRVPPPIEVLGMLHTPAQTFSSLLTMPIGDVEEWGARFQELMDGFYLLPMEREGRVRTGHKYVRTLHVEARDLRDDLAAR